MVRSYDRYEFDACFGVVNSKTSNSIFVNSNIIVTGNDENVSVWNVNEKEIKQRLTVPFVPPSYFFSHHVSYLCLNENNKNLLAVGYVNGSIRIFDFSNNKIVSTFQGHTSGIVRLKFNMSGNILCSCSKDTNIILWDVVNDRGIVKLEGHNNVVTDIEFIEMKKEILNTFSSVNLLVSVSKDCLIKLWDINIQACIQTVVNCEEEISCLVINEKKNRLIVACNSFLNIYKIDVYSKTKDKFSNTNIYISYLATIKRTTTCRIQNMRMVFIPEEDVKEQDEKDDGLDLLLQNKDDEIEGKKRDRDGDVTTEMNNELIGKEDNEEETKRKEALQFLNNSLTATAKICERTNYCFQGYNGILFCCTNVKKIECYKINSVKNQKKSERSRKKRHIEKLKKNRDKVLKELKRIAKFKGKNSVDYQNMKKKVDEINKEIDIYSTYQIHTATDEIKYMFNYTCKFKLRDIDIYRKREKDPFIYLLTAFTVNRINIFKVNLLDILHNKDTFHVKKVLNEEEAIKDAEQEENKKEEKETEEKEAENEAENEAEANSERDDAGVKDSTEVVVEKNIYDYSKCFKEVCEINKGHNTAIDFMNLSKTNELLVSICKKYVKIWNMKSFQNIITIEIEGCTSAFFCYDDEYLVISDELGYIYLYGLKNIELENTYRAHTNKIVNLFLNPNGQEFLSVAEEKYLKLFSLLKTNRFVAENEVEESDNEYVNYDKGNNLRKQSSKHCAEEEKNSDKLVLRFKEVQCHNLSDKASVAMFSPDGRFIAIGYLNNIIEVLYSDSARIHLTLYGHSLPITCLDISTDGKLLASGSSDKCLFIWNFEFGNINKRFHTNCEALTQVKFFNCNNNVVSVSRDGYIKLWDAVKFECICTLDGAFGCLTSIVIQKDDNYFLTAGIYKSIRCWKRNDEDLLFLEEERDKEFTLQIEQEALRNDFAYPSAVEKNVLLNKATIKTIESIKSSEKLIEYIDIIDEEIVLLETYYKNLQAYREAKSKNELPDFVLPPTKPSGKPELLNKNPYEFLIEILSNIKNNILDEIIIALPFSYAYKLLNFIKMYLKSFYFFERIQGSKKRFVTCGSFSYQLECSINIILTIINIYRNQFLFDTKFRFLLYELNVLITPHLKKVVDMCSFNQMTLNFLVNSLDDEGIDFEDELLKAQEEVKKVAEEKRQQKIQRLREKQKTASIEESIKNVVNAVTAVKYHQDVIPEATVNGNNEVTVSIPVNGYSASHEESVLNKENGITADSTVNGKVFKKRKKVHHHNKDSEQHDLDFNSNILDKRDLFTQETKTKSKKEEKQTTNGILKKGADNKRKKKFDIRKSKKKRNDG